MSYDTNGDFVLGFYRLPQSEQTRLAITEADLGARDWARGFDNDLWIKPGSETETALRSQGAVFGPQSRNT
jgi:hypothetical protein